MEENQLDGNKEYFFFHYISSLIVFSFKLSKYTKRYINISGPIMDSITYVCIGNNFIKTTNKNQVKPSHKRIFPCAAHKGKPLTAKISNPA